MDTPQITIVCLIKAKKEKTQQLQQELTALAKLSRQEEDNINYDLHISADDQSLFIIHENWKNQAALDNHMSQPHFKNFITKQDDLLEYPADIKICKIIK